VLEADEVLVLEVSCGGSVQFHSGGRLRKEQRRLQVWGAGSGWPIQQLRNTLEVKVEWHRLYWILLIEQEVESYKHA
jgi:hypothetical protein